MPICMCVVFGGLCVAICELDVPNLCYNRSLHISILNVGQVYDDVVEIVGAYWCRVHPVC